MKIRFALVLVCVLAVLVTACGKSPVGPDPQPTPTPTPSPTPGSTVQLIELMVRIADSSELGVPLNGPVAVGTLIRYNLIYGSQTTIPYRELTVIFRTLCSGQPVDEKLLPAGASPGGASRALYEFKPTTACAYEVQASMSGSEVTVVPPMKEASFEVR